MATRREDEDAHNPFGTPDTPTSRPPAKPGLFDDPFDSEDDDDHWEEDVPGTRDA